MKKWIGGIGLVVALMLVGCGGSGGDSSTADSSTANSSQAGGPGGFTGFDDETRECLEEQGVELPEAPQGGEPPQGGVPRGGPPEAEPPQGFGGEDMKKALEECGAELPPGGKPGGPPMNSGAFRKSIKQYASCMGKNGYELPDPNISGDGPVFKESDVDREDPKFKAADEKCQPLLGGPGEGGGA